MSHGKEPAAPGGRESFESRLLLTELVARPDERVPLAACALLVAAEEYPGLDVQSYMSRLEAMAERLRGEVPAGTAPRRRLQILNRFLFEQEGFAANPGEYYDPRNSFLNEVLDRRLGIPLTLSLLYIELGRRIGLPLSGVCFPGHFLVRYDAEDGHAVLDPWEGGAILSEEDCRERLRSVYGGRVPFDPGLLRPARPAEVLTRMLYNLKAIWVSRRDWDKAIRVTDLILLVNPEAGIEVRDRGMLQSRKGDYGKALADLRRYREMAPGAEDNEVVDRHIRELERILRSMN